MTLTQRSFLRPSVTLTLEAEVLRCVRVTPFSRYTFEVPVKDIAAKADEWESTSIRWCAVAATCAVFLGFHFSQGWHLGALWVLTALVYLSLGVYSTLIAWQKSGSYFIVHVNGANPRALWIHRKIPDDQSVAAFIRHLQESIRGKQAAEPGAAKNTVSAT